MNTTVKIVSYPFIRQVFYERVGCFSVGNIRILAHHHPPLETVQACSSIAWSRGLKVFAVHNGSKCLGDKNLPSMLSQLSFSKGCLGGRGGEEVSDVYRLTSKKAFPLFDLYISMTTFFKFCFSCNLTPQTKYIDLRDQRDSYSLHKII